MKLQVRRELILSLVHASRELPALRELLELPEFAAAAFPKEMVLNVPDDAASQVGAVLRRLQADRPYYGPLTPAELQAEWAAAVKGSMP
jgi:hypothetical protein